MDCQALIFDFDGTILDTETPEYQCWQEIYSGHGCELPLSVWSDFIGKASSAASPFDYLERQLGKPVERVSLKTRYRERMQEIMATQAVLPGVLDYLETARRLGLRIGLASSSRSDYVLDHLERLGLRHYFECVRGADQVKNAKPDPELYLAVLAFFNLQPDQAIALEDSPTGVLAARRAGLFCVAIPNSITGQLPLDHASLQVSSLADLPLETLLASLPQNIDNSLES
jgi:HAD superfamily hydrolase (TIGR01509 family)